MPPTSPDPRRLLGGIVALVLAIGVVVALVAGGDGGGSDEDARDGSSTTVAVEQVAFDCTAWNDLGGADDVTAEPDLTPLPVDDGLRAGTLDNDLRYLVRQNARPGQSVSLGLAVDAGAAIEDDDQHGAAHFLEHMLFNGTERFPGNELQDVLADLGVEFGADLNAFTSEDATVYFLDLANDRASIEQGLDVLFEWATAASIAPEDVEAERGVILEELRTGLDPDSRFFDRIRDLALAGTPYAGHEVIGTVESIEAMGADELRRYYEDWYRPELMSVVAVGDLDVDAVEAGIRERFGAIPASGDDVRPRPELESGLAGAPAFGSYVDDELLGTSAELVFSRPADDLVTRDDLRARVLRDVATAVLDTRLNDDAARGSVPFYEVDVSDYGVVEAFDGILLSVDAEPERLGDALQAVATEIARARRHGLGAEEASRAVEARRSQARAALAGAPTTQDRDVLFRLIEHALAGTPTTPVGPLAEAELALLDQVTPEAVAGELRRITDCTDLAVQAGVPPAYEEMLPDETRIVRALREAVEASAEPRPADEATPAQLLATPPEPVAPTLRRPVELFGPALSLEYPNGARVVIQPSDISAGFVTLTGSSPGGLAEVPDADLDHARVADDLANGSGVADLDLVDLGRVLAGTDVTASTEIGTDEEAVYASGATADLETMLQLVHLRMTSPRIDDGALATYRGENRLRAEDPGRRADTAVTAARDELLWRGDPRYRELPTVELLEGLDADASLAQHRARFGDVSDFVFVIVGDVDLASAEALVGRYLGTLPGAGRLEDGTHERPAVPGEVTARVIEAGSAPQARIEVTWEVEVPTDPVRRDRAQALVAVLDDRLRVRLREELGATYGPEIGIVTDEGAGRMRTTIRLESDPARADDVADEIQTVVAALRASAPSDDEVRRAVEPLRRDLQFISLATVTDSWLRLVRDGVSVQDLPAAAEDRLAAVTPEDIRALVNELLPVGAYVELVQVPEP